MTEPLLAFTGPGYGPVREGKTVKPKLIAIAGPAEGSQFVLADAETRIGRDPSNRICLQDLSVSRHHCSILSSDGEFQLEDRGSLNNTFVNGIPVKEHKLRSGDRIRAGDSLLLFLLDEELDTDSSPTHLTEDRLITKNTLQLRKDSAMLFQTTEQPVISTATSRSTRDLNALLKISLAVNSIRNLDSLQRHLLTLIFEVIPASRGVILLSDEKTEDITSVFSRHRVTNQTDPIKVSRRVTERLLSEGVALLSNDVTEDVSLRDAPSLSFYNIHALLAVPLLISSRTLGLIYLDTPDADVRFDKDHLQLMRAIASISAVALENIRQVNQLENENRRLQAEIAIEHDMVGQSPRMREVYQFITKVASTNSTVLICG
ncbi:MAG: FHA domain-containing protein, partial [Acidobacteriota bacterium]